MKWPVILVRVTNKKRDLDKVKILTIGAIISADISVIIDQIDISCHNEFDERAKINEKERRLVIEIQRNEWIHSNENLLLRSVPYSLPGRLI